MSGSEHDGWMYQGRQQHGWFGNGTKPHDLDAAQGPAGIAAPATFEERLDAIIYGMIGAVPKRERAMVETRMDAVARARLRGAMLAWAGAEHLDRATFQTRFLPSSVSDKVVGLMRSAAATAQRARTYADLRDASEMLGAVAGELGVWRWSALVAEAGQRAAIAVVTPVADRRAAQPVATAPGGSPFTPDGRMPDLTPVPLLDDNGIPVIKDGKLILRPRGVDPHFFTQAGEEARSNLLQDPPDYANIGAELLKFRQGREWDIQRLTGSVNRDFIGFSTVVIGIYGASVGIPEWLLLSLQDTYAKDNSDFGNAARNRTYTHLAEANVANTRLGYELFRSGRIRVLPPR